VLTVKVRAATTLRWLKNGVELKDGADGGRITGVTTEQLTFAKILGRDTDQKVWCEATNKWGTVKSKIVYLRIPNEERSAMPVPAGKDVRVLAADEDKMKHKKKFGASLAAVDTGTGSGPVEEKPLAPTGSIRSALGRQYSGHV